MVVEFKIMGQQIVARGGQVTTNNKWKIGTMIDKLNSIGNYVHD